MAKSRLAPLAAASLRLGAVARHDSQVLRHSASWLVHSREHTNYTFELSDLNLKHLAWWVANVAEISVDQARAYMAEVADDQELAEHVRTAIAASPRGRLADPVVRLHKRIGWYALVRALQPQRIVETGTDKGLGSVVLASALLRNGSGRLTTIDINSDSGYLITGKYAAVVDIVRGDSVEKLTEFGSPVDFFLHDSLHTREYELAELAAVDKWLSPTSVALSDNADLTDALPDWAERVGRRFHYFAEEPKDHWFPGGGIGLAKKA